MKKYASSIWFAVQHQAIHTRFTITGHNSLNFD